MKKLLPLLLFAWACTSTPPESGERRNLPLDTTPSVKVSSEAGYQEVEDTTTPKFSSVYAFLDSVKPYCGKNIHQFASSWYAYAYHGNDYKAFQQFGVVFPFQYVIQDSVGAEKTLILSSVNDFASFRRNQYPGLNAWGLSRFGSPRRVVWEGYPHEGYGPDLNGNLSRDFASGEVVVTYLFPKNRVDYYFRRENGIWRVFKRVQKKYSQRELEQVAEESFEGFVLRFISDKQFRLASIRWPHVKYFRQPLQEPQDILSSKEESGFYEEPQEIILMAFYEGFQKDMIENDTMYLRSIDEGGGCYSHHFTKINNRWTLVETWDASN